MRPLRRSHDPDRLLLHLPRLRHEHRLLLSGCARQVVRLTAREVSDVVERIADTTRRAGPKSVGYGVGRWASRVHAQETSTGTTAEHYGSKLCRRAGFTGTIRGATASGVFEDSTICPGKKFDWSARRAR